MEYDLNLWDLTSEKPLSLCFESGTVQSDRYCKPTRKVCWKSSSCGLQHWDSNQFKFCQEILEIECSKEKQIVKEIEVR